ncbi:MAG: Hsp20/alpha crystallin family protein [Candidatus Caldarchaeum sp.]|nr:Hsp20/alpha crystallin family protein [Candidatus Caldarchaeum sp.]
MAGRRGWDDFFARIGEEVEERIREAIEQSVQTFERFSGDYRRPRTDYRVTSTHIYIIMEMPGCAKETIDLQADETTITVTAEYMTPDKQYSLLYPFSHGKGYRKSLKTPRPIDPSKIEAKYEAGLLFVKAQIALPKGVKIPIE